MREKATAKVEDPIATGAVVVLEECKQLLEDRGRQYGGSLTVSDYMPHGNLSYHQMCWLKLQRAWNQIQTGQNPEDSLLDLINYAAFWAASIQKSI